MNTGKILRWTPRVLLILFIIFLSLFAFDSFSEPGKWYILLLGFLIHLIPSFILIIFLAIAWKFEMTGGILFLLMGIGFGIFFDAFEEIISFLLLVLPLWVIGGLFLGSYYLSKKKKEKKPIKKEPTKRVKSNTKKITKKTKMKS